MARVSPSPDSSDTLASGDQVRPRAEPPVDHAPVPGVAAVQGLVELPHTLILARLYDELDPDEPQCWDTAELTCPHDPSALMPCAVWTPCRCKPLAHETDWEGEGGGPCAESATGEHHYFEGEPQKPEAACWAVDHADGLKDAAWNLDLLPGRYMVRPWHEWGVLRLDLWHWAELVQR